MKERERHPLQCQFHHFFCHCHFFSQSFLSQSCIYGEPLSTVWSLHFLPPREEAKEQKKRKAEEKKAARQAKKLAEKEAEGEPEPKKRKKKDKDKDDKAADHRNLQRTRGAFKDEDPEVLKSGADLPTTHRVQPLLSVSKFLQSVSENKVSLLRLKKGSIKKICSFGLGLGKHARPKEPLTKEQEVEMKQWVNTTAQARQTKPFSHTAHATIMCHTTRTNYGNNYGMKMHDAWNGFQYQCSLTVSDCDRFWCSFDSDWFWCFFDTNTDTDRERLWQSLMFL